MDQINPALKSLATVLCASLLLGACSLTSHRSPEPSPGESLSAPPSVAQPSLPSPTPRPPPVVRENHLSPATRSLVTQAKTQLARGDLPGASSTLDRAVRIEPNNPLLWIEMGRLRLAENDAHQAEGCGRKALALASGDRSAQAQAGRVLADALRAQGRNQEAREVEQQSFMR
jgi:uncharacterized protein HemY